VGGKWQADYLIKMCEEVAGCSASWDYDIAVDPVDGTTQTAKGGYEAMSVIALGSKDCLLATPAHYMNKIAVGKHVSDNIPISIKMPIEEIVESIKLVLNKNQITVCVLDRPRHNQLVSRFRACGCSIKFIQDCDVSGAIAAALPESGRYIC
jgi:fructose-1,6-bisphosphatase/sedoheptulose 1,7-bisphosphatase-like protein